MHEAHAAAEVGDGHQVVRDEEVAQADVASKIAQHLHHLDLRGGVERAHGLVKKDHLRLDRHGARDAHALKLATRELVRIAVHEVGPEAHALEKSAGRAVLLLGRDRAARATQRPEGLVQDRGDAKARIDGRRVVLEDDRDAVADPRELLGRVTPVERRAVEEHLARIGPEESAEHASEGRLARARLADDAQALALFKLEAHAVEDRGALAPEEARLVFLSEGHPDVPGFKQHGVLPFGLRP